VLVPTETNLVNDNWADRPSCPSNPIHGLPVAFAGKSVADKLVDVRQALTDEGASALVVSELEEVAWLLNLRGADLPQASVFFGFVIVRQNNLDIFVTAANIPEATRNELIALGAEFHPYNDFGTVLEDIVQNLPATEKIWVSKYANSFVANSVESSGKQIIKLTPIILMKSLKNPVEVEGMRRAHLKDSAAIIAFLSWLEIQLDTAGAAAVSEISGADYLYTIRQTGEDFVDQSFSTISGFGSNGAVIHYRPTEETNKNITKDGLYLLDSGGLYWDGTTDITRTVHFGTPTAEQKDRFTRVLRGHIAIAKAVFPNKLPGYRLDSFARRPLWEINEDYKHGTGHGIGHYLNVHEGPQKMSFFVAEDDSGLQENMFISNEPGFYKDGEYGIRIENIVRIAKSKYEGSLEIETVSFVPIQTKLIDLNIMSEDEIKWVNDYNMACREKVLEYMKANPTNVYFGPETQDYLTKETNPIGGSDSTTPSDSSDKPDSSTPSDSSDKPDSSTPSESSDKPDDSSAPIGFMSNCQFVLTASIATYIAQLLLAQ